MRAGRLIIFEGSEGAGKTTQIRALAETLRDAGIETLALREPGGTRLGDSIRTILLDSPEQMSAAAEALMFMASRAELVRAEIDPALERGVVVLMDRFFLSTYAYQIYGRGLPESQIVAANALAAGGRVPDLTLVLDVEHVDGLKRAAVRGSHDRIERSGQEFHARVAEAFAMFTSRDWQLVHPECGPVERVDGSGDPETVLRRVREVLVRKLPDPFKVLNEAEEK